MITVIPLYYVHFLVVSHICSFNHCSQVYSYPNAFFTFNCYPKCSGKTVNLKCSDLLYNLHFGNILCMVNNCAWSSKPLYFRFTVFSCVFTVISHCNFIFAVYISMNNTIAKANYIHIWNTSLLNLFTHFSHVCGEL